MCKPIKITPPQAAALMGKSQLYVYEGLRRGVFPFGFAMKLTDDLQKWNYFISPPQLAEYLGISLSELIEEVNKL